MIDGSVNRLCAGAAASAVVQPALSVSAEKGDDECSGKSPDDTDQSGRQPALTLLLRVWTGAFMGLHGRYVALGLRTRRNSDPVRRLQVLYAGQGVGPHALMPFARVPAALLGAVEQEDAPGLTRGGRDQFWPWEVGGPKLGRVNIALGTPS